jgi:mRNA-degrading endonuclease toxin of MazEF toxin-antitoxin module
MIEAGDIHVADLNNERRCRVLVLSNSRFHRMCDRVLVAPEVAVEPGEVLFPWRVQIDDAVYAVDLTRGLHVDRLLERTDRAPAAAMAAARRALLNIT